MSVPRDDHRMAFIRHVRHIDADRRTLKYKNVINETPGRRFPDEPAL